jgi:ATP-dependent DNA ligase
MTPTIARGAQGAPGGPGRGGDTEHIQFSGTFADPIKLLATCERMRLEGIVSKRRDSAYRSGPTRDWLKTKMAVWRAANRDRF